MSSSSVGYEIQAGRNEQVAEFSDCEDILFRYFRPQGDDEEQMRELLFNNAFLGQPFDPICQCEDWFGDVVLTPYIQYQRENIQVAVDKASGRVVGYLTGSTGGQRFEKTQYDMVRKKVVSLAVYLTMPWSYLDLSSRLFAAHLIFKGESERPNHPQSGAHWHFQVDKEFRGRKVGTHLLRRFVDDAIRAGFDLIWAEVMAYPDKPPAYFEERGWSIHDARPTTIFRDHVGFPVEVLCITRPLASFEEQTKAA